MAEETFKERIRKIVADRLLVDKASVVDDATFVEDLGADSLDLMELIMAFEGEFNINIPDQDAEGIKTFAHAVAYLEKNSKEPQDQ